MQDDFPRRTVTSKYQTKNQGMGMDIQENLQETHHGECDEPAQTACISALRKDVPTIERIRMHAQLRHTHAMKKYDRRREKLINRSRSRKESVTK